MKAGSYIKRKLYNGSICEVEVDTVPFHTQVPFQMFHKFNSHALKSQIL